MRAKRLFQRKMQHRQGGELRRSEYRAFLFAALCALLVLSPATSAPLFAASPLAASSLAASSLAASSLVASVTSAPPDFQAVLWWLRHTKSTSTEHRNLTAPAALSLLSDLSSREIAALLEAIEQPAHNGSADANISRAASFQVNSSHSEESQHHPYQWQLSLTVALPLAPAVHTARRATSATLQQISLTAHEAATLSGVHATHPRE